MLLVGFASSLPFASIKRTVAGQMIPLAVCPDLAAAPSALAKPGAARRHPQHRPMLPPSAAFDQITLAPWQVMYAVAYPCSG